VAQHDGNSPRTAACCKILRVPHVELETVHISPSDLDSTNFSDENLGSGLTLNCPVRGQLKVSGRTADGLSPSEEARRVEAIRFLLDRGYQKEYILIEPIIKTLGHAGRNSIRADVAVTTIPANEVRAKPPDQRVNYCRILGEIKRDHDKAKKAKETQVEPLIAFGPPGCLAFYWDSIEQRLFWHDRKKQTREGYIAALPREGEKFGGLPKLTIGHLQPAPSLLGLFDRVGDALHSHGIPKQDRYDIILHILLAKLYDERTHEDRPDDPLDIQDPVGLDMDFGVAKQRFNGLLDKTVAYYGTNLHRELQEALDIDASALAHALEVLAPHRIGHASRSAMQDFFMKFAKDLYKWDMAQYFTPTPLTEYIVDVANPRASELVKDPAVGSGDFLMAASERDYGSARMKPRLFGADMSETAAQVAELNKILHNATNCDIRVADTLANIDSDFCVKVTKSGEIKGRYTLLICNPPFGSRIVVKDPDILKKFDLAYAWKQDKGEWARTDRLLKSQETGILFAEACVRQAMNDGGRVAIIVPNGYLGNRTPKFNVLREWLLRHTRVAAIISFPRFTFKSSGADVSASLLLLERRQVPLAYSRDSDNYPIAIELLERVGWEVGQKNGGPIYERDQSDGAIVLDKNNKPIIDADFRASMKRLRNSDAGRRFEWLAGTAPSNGDAGHCISVRTVLADDKRCLDPKRYCAKVMSARTDIIRKKHFKLGDVVAVVPELTSQQIGVRLPSDLFRYVEIQDTGPGLYSTVELRGWQLPQRARHGAEPGDVFVGAIWGSVTKWFVAGAEEKLVVTNGFHRLRVSKGKLVDVLTGLCSEAFAVQARAAARGSDGLAEITEDDLKLIVLPEITNRVVRTQLQTFVDQLLEGHVTMKVTVDQLTRAHDLPLPYIPPRPSHVVLV
jgi:type I restriction enzyme M protein